MPQGFGCLCSGVTARLNGLLLLGTTAGHFTLFGVSAGRAELSIMGSGWGLIGIHWRKCMSVTCLWVKHLYAIVLKPLTSLEGIQGHCGLAEGNYIPDFLYPKSTLKVRNIICGLPHILYWNNFFLKTTNSLKSVMVHSCNMYLQSFVSLSRLW